MQLSPSFIKELTIDQAVAYMANQYNLIVSSTNICQLIITHQLKAYLRLLEPFLAKEELAPNLRILGTEEPLPHHPEIYYQVEAGAIRSMDLVTIPAQTLELGMVNSDILAVQSRLTGANMTSGSGLAITLVNTLKNVVYYLYTESTEPFSYGEYTPLTWIPRSSEIIIKVDELDFFLEKSGYERISNLPHEIEAFNSIEPSQESLNEKKEEALLRTIGALAKLAAHLGGHDVGTFDKPNAQGLLRKLEELSGSAGEELPDGFGKSTWANRIKQGKEAYDRGK